MPTNHDETLHQRYEREAMQYELSLAESPEFRVHVIKTRRLDIAATLANWKRDYLAQGIERSRGERATLEAEDANLALEIRQISDAAHRAKIERRKREDGRLLNQLLAVLGEQGLQDVVAEAQRRAQDAQA